MIPVLIIPVLTRADLLYRMLETIDHPVERLIVVDNGDCVSGFELAEKAKPHCTWVTHLRMPSNLGVPASWNIGIKSTPHAPFWMVSNFDVTFPPGSLAGFANDSKANTVLLAQAGPPWCCFTIGEQVIAKVGLFDEAFYPAYWEDIDYEQRCKIEGIKVVESTIPVHHENSSTINNMAHRNNETYPVNEAYYRDKVQRGDASEGHWSLHRRRALSWD